MADPNERAEDLNPQPLPPKQADKSISPLIWILLLLAIIAGTDVAYVVTHHLLRIVIVILGVLTGIVVFAVGAFTNRGEVSACRTAMKTVETAIETYRAQNSGAMPGDINDLVPDYLRTDPTDPTLAANAQYVVTINYATGQVEGELADGTDCLD